MGTNAVEEAAQYSREREGRRQPNRHRDDGEYHALAKYELTNRAELTSESNADTNLARAAADRVADDAVKADRCQCKSYKAKDAEESACEAR